MPEITYTPENGFDVSTLSDKQVLDYTKWSVGKAEYHRNSHGKALFEKLKERTKQIEEQAESESSESSETITARREISAAHSKIYSLKDKYDLLQGYRKQARDTFVREEGKARGIPKGRRQGSFSSAEKYSRAIQLLYKQSEECAEVEVIEKQLGEIKHGIEQLETNLEKMNTDRNRKDYKRLPKLVNGTVLISKQSNQIALRIGEYKPDTGKYTTESGSLSGEEFFSAYQTCDISLSPRAATENYWTIKQFKEFIAIEESVEIALQASRNFMDSEAAKAKAESERADFQKRCYIKPGKPSIAAFLQADDGATRIDAKEYGKGITNGKWLLLDSAVPPVLAKRAEKYPTQGKYKDREVKAYYTLESALGSAKPLELVGFLKPVKLGAYDMTVLRIAPVENYWAKNKITVIQSGYYNWLTNEGFTFAANADAMEMKKFTPIAILKDGEPAGAIMPIEIEQNLEDLLTSIGIKIWSYLHLTKEL